MIQSGLKLIFLRHPLRPFVDERTRAVAKRCTLAKNVGSVALLL